MWATLFRKGNEIMRDECPVERNLRVKQGAFFRAAAKAGFGIALLAEEIGEHRSTLDSYIEKPSRPRPSIMSLAMFIKLASVPSLPPHIAALLIEDSGLDLVSRDPQRANWLALGAKAAAFSSKVCAYQASDNHIDHREDADLRNDIIEIISDGQGAVARLG